MALFRLVRKAAKFSRTLISEQLSPNMHFHNLQHTQYVVNAVTQIGIASKISNRDMAVLQIAGWFHDTGYCYSYLGHEDNSIAIAATFLTQHDADQDIIDEVTACISATKMPQVPATLLQQIICDADMFHLADERYTDFADRLRQEWELVLHKHYTDEEWTTTNLNMLVGHKYFTDYCKTILQEYKLVNIDELLS